MNMNKVDFSVPLTGSKLFDIWAYNTANKLCAKFIGLQFKMEDHRIHIFGELNDMWYEKFNRAVFQLGNIDDV